MNSGLPSLLDAIFGKNDLASVSLDEMYEVVNEFPSFNAAHFFLSKKLKQQNDEAYEMESRRTALYFNNAFWLQTLLDEKNNIERVEISSAVEEYLTAEVLLQVNDRNEPVTGPDEASVSFEEPVVFVIETSERVDEPIVSFEESVPSFFVPEPPVDEQEPGDAEKVPGTVTSFDELISKYHIEGIEPDYRVAEQLAPEPVHEVPNEIPVELEETTVSLHEEPVQEYDSDFISRPEERIHNTLPHTEYYSDFESGPEERIPDTVPHPESDQYETFEEVVNEYGIFEEVRVKKSDLDWEAFDRPIENGTPAHEPVPPEISQTVNENIVENQSRYEPVEKSDEQDYESFDRPLDDSDREGQPEERLAAVEILSGAIISAADDTDHSDADDTDFVQPDKTEKKGWLSGSPDISMDDPSQLAFKRFEGEKKSVAPFDVKKAGSIVFAPYHMIDYFASQGIKLVLEDNPPDNLGKQLKSFTDWLKVMKRLPVQSASEKPDEKEADRIRHFAAHSIEERDILTESMAEVLAKQGMYENAIALYQKLSLIYPPKSAYFASRIEQLKASIP